MLPYHARSLALVGVAPRVVDDAAPKLAAVEKRIGRPLPESVREWYSLQGAADLLTKYSNADPAVALDHLGLEPPVELADPNLLIIRQENQGVCAWAVQLDGSDDPPVVVDRNLEFKTYRNCAATFSDYVFSCVWDYTFVFGQEVLIQAQHMPLSERAVGFLREHFKTDVTTRGWPASTSYRFYSEDQRILIWAGERQADWWLAADHDYALQQLMTQLWKVDRVGRSFWSASSLGEQLIQSAMPV